MIIKLSMVRFGMSILLILIAHCVAVAQYSSENFVRYTSKDGLSDNYITSIQQDSLGFLWIGTENGLNRFDGYSFKNYLFDSPPGFLVSSIIRKLKLFNEHELGIISNSGFQILNPLTMQVRNFIIPDTTPFVALRNTATDAIQLHNSQCALVTYSGFYLFDSTGRIDFKYDAYDIDDYGLHSVRYGRQLFQSGSDLLIYHDSRGLAHFNSAKKIYTEVDSAFTKWVPFMHPVAGDAVHWITKAQVDENEFIFLSALDSFIYYNSVTHKRVSSPVPFHWSKEFSWSSLIMPMNDSLFVITGSYSGLYFFTLDSKSGQIRLDNQKILPDYKILSVFNDRENRLWVGTRTGLLRQVIDKPLIEKFEWQDPINTSLGFTDAIIHNNILYLSRLHPEAGLIAVQPDSMKILKEFKFFDQNKWNIVSSMEMYHPDTIWLGTDGGLIWFDTKSWKYGKLADVPAFKNDFVGFDILGAATSDGIAWLLLHLEGRLAQYNIHDRRLKIFDAHSDPAIPFTTGKHIAYDSYGDVWMGGHFLTRWNHKTMQFDTLIKYYAGPHKYNENILAMTADKSGSLWLHNAENGLLQYRIRKNVYKQFSLKDGLPSDNIISLSPIIDGILFMVTPHHLVRMDTRNYGIEIFGNESDLPDDQIYIGRTMYWHEESKKMFAFFRNGIIRFPLHRPSEGLSGNDIIVQEVVINNEEKIYYPGNDIKLKHTQNTLAISYTVIDFEQSNDYQFAYNFNHSKEWTSVASQRVIHFTNLRPGEHYLQIRATGKAGKQKVSHFNFTILRPFWNQAWFYPFMAVLISSIIYWIFRTRESRIREKANLDSQIAIAEMKALHAQMNPHFIFNSLNSIKEMVLQNDAKDASRYLSDFAHLIRMTLDHSRQAFVSLRSTMEYLMAYVKMEQIRKSNFSFQMDAEPGLDPDETLIPPMLIQPFIENAIWHGGNGHKNSINIRVNFKRFNGHLLCTIEDDGIGIDKSKEKKNGSKTSHHSVGIDNIQTRIDLLNQKHHFKSKIDITDKHVPGNGAITGTIVKITLPLEIQEQA